MTYTYVQIADENGELLELPLEEEEDGTESSHRTLPMSTLRAYFPGATGLIYKVDKTDKRRGVRVDNSRVYLPKNGQFPVYSVYRGTGPELIDYPEPSHGDLVKLWSLMSNQGDGFISVAVKDSKTKIVKDGTKLKGNGSLDQELATFKLEKTTAGVRLETIGKSDNYYITTKSSLTDVFLNKTDPTLQQTFHMERWPMSTKVANAGCYVRFKVPNTDKNSYLGCSGEGVVSVMEQKEPANSGFENFFPNPGTLFFLYDLEK